MVCCLEIGEGAGHDALNVTGSLAGVYFAQGDYGKALKCYGRALAGREKSLGRETTPSHSLPSKHSIGV
jgi:hypothetical protein